MVCLGLEPGAAGWKAQTNPLSYGGIKALNCSTLVFMHSHWLLQNFNEHERSKMSKA